MYGRFALGDISPPSSPDADFHGYISREVSPIDDDDDFMFPAYQVKDGSSQASLPRSHQMMLATPTSSGDAIPHEQEAPSLAPPLVIPRKSSKRTSRMLKSRPPPPATLPTLSTSSTPGLNREAARDHLPSQLAANYTTPTQPEFRHPADARYAYPTPPSEPARPRTYVPYQPSPNQAKAIRRKPPPPASASQETPPAPRRASAPASADKPLPLAPPELLSLDNRVAHLNAVLDGLAHRRVNVLRGIQQMTELMPPDDELARFDPLRRREMEKRKIERLQEELAEIRRQEHELGLKLHRMHKRQDREAVFEHTTLWVKRVVD